MKNAIFVLKYGDDKIEFDNPANHFPHGIVGMNLNCKSWQLTKHGENVALPNEFKSYTTAIRFLDEAEPKKAEKSEPISPKSKIKFI